MTTTMARAISPSIWRRGIFGISGLVFSLMPWLAFGGLFVLRPG